MSSEHNLHGEMETSNVSVVAADDMVEIARINTCTMPHGSCLNGDGTKHYLACMMDEEVVEIDARTLGVSRHFFLTKGREMGMTGAPPVRGADAQTGTRTGTVCDSMAVDLTGGTVAVSKVAIELPVIACSDPSSADCLTKKILATSLGRGEAALLTTQMRGAVL